MDIDNNIIELFQKKIPTIDNFGALGPRFMNVNNKTHKQQHKKKMTKQQPMCF